MLSLLLESTFNEGEFEICHYIFFKRFALENIEMVIEKFSAFEFSNRNSKFISQTFLERSEEVFYMSLTSVNL